MPTINKTQNTVTHIKNVLSRYKQGMVWNIKTLYYDVNSYRIVQIILHLILYLTFRIYPVSNISKLAIIFLDFLNSEHKSRTTY